MAKIEFRRELVRGINGMSAVFTCKGQETSDMPFQVIADRTGVRFKGDSPFFTQTWELQEFAKTIDHALKDHWKFSEEPVDFANVVSPKPM